MMLCLCQTGRRSRGFTLIEIMVVIAIIGLIMAMGLPSLFQAFKAEGMRRAIQDIQKVCQDARSQAIFNNQTTYIYIYPGMTDRRFQLGGEPITGGAALADAETLATTNNETPSGGTTSGVLPDDVQIEMFDINQQDFAESAWGRVRFFPNGTSDEMVLVLRYKNDTRMIKLEYSTALTDVTEVHR